MRIVFALLLLSGFVALVRLFVVRAKQRKQVREHAEHASQQALERLEVARQKTGGSPKNPIEITSPAVVEPRAESKRCPACDGGCRLAEHRVMQAESGSLRVARLVCKQCGLAHDVFFRIAQLN